MNGAIARSAVSRAEIVAEARRWIGTPYMHQASLIHSGCDCLGLVRGVWRQVIGPEPETTGGYSPDWSEAHGGERLLEAGQRHFSCIAGRAWQAGDVLLFRWRAHLPAKHVGVATSPDSMVHAHEGACVCEVTIGPFWRRRLTAAFMFPGAVE